MPRRHAADLLIDHVAHDWSDAIGRIRLPTLVIGGRRSIFSAESQEWIAAQIPGARLRIFDEDEGGSHFMFLENPGGFNEEVRSFLAATRQPDFNPAVPAAST
jgi:pimeloyl-ACP methyl ester carboxylesterase